MITIPLMLCRELPLEIQLSLAMVYQASNDILLEEYKNSLPYYQEILPVIQNSYYYRNLINLLENDIKKAGEVETM